MSLADGIYEDLQREAYDDIDRPGWSLLKPPMGRSPAHCLAALKGKSTDALSLGIASHLAILEPLKFMECAVWRGAVRRGKEWEAFKAANEGRQIITEEEQLTAAAMAGSVRLTQSAAALLCGKSEVTLLWTFNGVPLKARLDHWSSRAGILDVKSAADASPRGFGSTVARYDYLGQAAMYQDGLEALTGAREPFAFVVVEKEAPYVTQVYTVADEYLMLGRTRYRSLLSRYVECRERNEWEGYSRGPLALKLPNWALSSEWE